MNPKIVAGVSGVASLAILALLGSRSQTHSINKRAIIVEENDDLLVIDDEPVDAEPAWNEDNLARFLKDFQTMDDVQIKKQFNNNFNSLKSWWKELDDIRPQMVEEHEDRMKTGQTWAMNLVTPEPATFPPSANPDGGTCEAGYTADAFCAPIDGMDNTSPKVQSLITDNGCEAADYSPFLNDDNTNVWFMIPKAVPLWVNGGVHIDEWAKYFNFVRAFVERHWKVDHRAAGRTVRLTIGLYMSGVQLLPKGIKLSQNSPLGKLLRWYAKPSVSARKPKFTSVLKVLDQAIGNDRIYKINTANGVLAGSDEDRDNCYALVFLQDIPTDLVALHQRKSETSNKLLAGDMIESLNRKCNMNYAFVMKDINVEGSNANEFYKKMRMVLQPGLADYFPFDPDYSGFYALDNMNEVVSDNFHNHIRNAMCLQSARQQCRLRVAGIKQSPTVATEYDGDYETATGDYENYEEGRPTEGTWIGEETGSAFIYGDNTAADFKELEETPDPQCCGGTIYTAKHFNNALKQCNPAGEDGTVSTSPRF